MRGLALILGLALLAPLVCAQQTPPPAPAKPDITGIYSFVQEGETLQLGVDAAGAVDGVVSRLGQGDTDKGRLFDHLFTKASLKNDELTFATRTVHAIWYEFKGHVQRGQGKKPGDEDYYEIVGTLTEHTVGPNNSDSARSREVTFKSFPTETDKEANQP